MDFDDLIEGFDAGLLSLLIPLGFLGGALLVRQAAKRFRRVSERYGLGVTACGLTGERAARRLLDACGLEHVAVVCTTRRDHYEPKSREVHLTPANYAGGSLAALAIAAHEAGHAQQFASWSGLYRLRLACWGICQALALAALLLLVRATVAPLLNPGLALVVLSAIAVALQAGITLPLERDASSRARVLVRKVGLIAPGEEAGFDRLLNAAWLTYAAAEARRGLGLLVVGLLVVAGASGLGARPDGAQSPGAPFDMAILTAAPLVVLGLVVLQEIRRHRRPRPSRAERALERNNEALKSYTEGRFDVAVKQLDGVIALQPGCAAAHYNRASAYLQLRQWDNALADFDRALALDPKLPEARRMRGNIWLERGDYDRALADFDAAVARAPEGAAAWRDRGLTRLWRGALDEALADLDEAIRLDANDAVAFNNRGVVRMKRGEPALARADLLEAIRLDPALPNPRNHLASLEEACLNP
jgi:Zn-dependent membrane protease YugP/Tfp pilus assembly protein PilF